MQLFKVNQSKADLIPPSQMINMMWQEINPRTVLTDDNFFGQTHYFEWSISKSTWAILSYAYVKVKYTLTKGAANNPVTLADDVGLSVCPVSAMIDQARLTFGGMNVLTVSHFPQVNALHNRIMYGDPQNRTFLKPLSMLDESLHDRQMKLSKEFVPGPLVESDMYEEGGSTEFQLGAGIIGTTTLNVEDGAAATDQKFTYAVGANLDLRHMLNVGDLVAFSGTDGRRYVSFVTALTQFAVSVRGRFVPNTAAADVAHVQVYRLAKVHKVLGGTSSVGSELFMRPSLALFTDPNQSALGSGTYRLEFDTYTKDRAIAGFLHGRGNPSDYTLKISDIKLYMPVVVGPPMPAGNQYMQFIRTQCNFGSSTITPGSETIDNFTVHDSTEALSFALGDKRDSILGVDSSKFHISHYRSALRLENLRINYAAQTRPAIPVRMEYEPQTGLDRGAELYYRTISELEQHLSIGGCEPLHRYRKLGPFYYFKFVKEGGHRATDVSVRYTVKGAAGFGDANANTYVDNDVKTNARALLFEHARKTLVVKRNEAGAITAVTEDFI